MSKVSEVNEVHELETLELPEELARVSIASPGHLRRWLRDTGRHWLVFSTAELVDALPWPRGVETLMLIIDGYRQHRCVQYVEDYTPDGEKYRRAKTDRLELDELRLLKEWVDATLDAEEQRLASGAAHYARKTAKRT